MKKRTAIVIVAGVLVAILLWIPKRRDPTRDASVDPVRSMTPPTTEIRSPRAAPLNPRPLDEPAGERLARLLNDDAARETLKLNAAELDEYLARNHTNASSLLIAFEASHDRDFLRKAAEAFPGDPFVQAKILFHNIYPEQRQEWINRLKESAPDNSLPNLLAAQESIRNGDAPGALAEILAGRGKKLDDFTRETMAGLEEAYLLAGRSTIDAKALGSTDVLLPQLAPFKRVAMDLRDLAAQSGHAGDTATQVGLLESAWIMGAQLRESGQQGALLNELVGLAIQNIGLQQWPDDVNATFLNRPVADELSANAAFRNQVRTGSATWNQWFPQASENEIIAFYERLRLFGERNAMEWIMRLHPEFVPQGTLVSEK